MDMRIILLIFLVLYLTLERLFFGYKGLKNKLINSLFTIQAHILGGIYGKKESYDSSSYA